MKNDNTETREPVSEWYLEQAFADAFDCAHEDIDIAGYTYTASDILRSVDPIAWGEELSSWLNTCDEFEEINGNYYRTEGYNHGHK